MNKNAKWISHPSVKDEAPYFRRELYIDKIPIKADIDICGLGYYELYINGQKADERLFTPPFTQYNVQIYYDTYDITKYIKPGKNVIGIILGNGAYNNNVKDAIGFDHAEWNARPCLICDVKFDGKTVLVSDRQFKTSVGAITYNALRVGETYDARKEENWMADDYDAQMWLTPNIVRPPGGKLEYSGDMPVKITAEYEAVKVWDVNENTKVYDFGQNISGFILMSGTAPAGSRVIFKYSEKLGDNGDIDQSNIDGLVYHEEFQTDKYIFSDNEEKGWHPRFTYHGFRYVKVINENNAQLSLKACLVSSDMKSAGEFFCSDQLLNKLQQNTKMSTITNFLHMPTDCPHREKQAWTGDAQLSVEQTLFNFDAKDFYMPWIRMFPYAQRNSGFIPATIPRPGCCYVDHDGPVWDSALFIIPEKIYLYTGDKSAIETVYPACKKYLEYAYDISEDYIIVHGHGDWCNSGVLCDMGITSTAYYYIMAQCMEQFAEILEKEEDKKTYKELKNAIKKAYQNRFIKNGIMEDGTQCAYAITLANKLEDKKDTQVMREELVKTVENARYHINGGILDAKYLLCTLSEIGRHDLAMKIARQIYLVGVILFYREQQRCGKRGVEEVRKIIICLAQ